MGYPVRKAGLAAVREVSTIGPIRIRFEGAETKSVLLDALTASAITAVYDAVNDENKAKIERMLASGRATFYRVASFSLSKCRGIVAA